MNHTRETPFRRTARLRTCSMCRGPTKCRQASISWKSGKKALNVRCVKNVTSLTPPPPRPPPPTANLLPPLLLPAPPFPFPPPAAAPPASSSPSSSESKQPPTPEPEDRERRRVKVPPPPLPPLPAAVSPPLRQRWRFFRRATPPLLRRLGSTSEWWRADSSSPLSPSSSSWGLGRMTNLREEGDFFSCFGDDRAGVGRFE